MARHVGRPTNEEVAARKRKQLAKIIVPVSIVLVLIVLLSTNKLTGLMGNTSYDSDNSEYYCENSGYTLKGDKCYSIERTDSILLGNVNQDTVIDGQDVELLQKIIDDDVEYTQLQYLAADVDQNGVVDDMDKELLAVEATGHIAAPVYANSETIGVLRLCPDSEYELDGTTCKKTTVVDAIKNENPNSSEQPAETGSGTANNNIINIQNLSVPDETKIYDFKDYIYFKMKFVIPGGQEYYRQTTTYYDYDDNSKTSKLNYIGPCMKITNNEEIEPSLKMVTNNRYLVESIYTDSECSIPYKINGEDYKYQSPVYKANLKTTVLETGMKNTKINDELSVDLFSPIKLPYNTDQIVQYEIKFNIESNNKFYYSWTVTKDDLAPVTTVNCQRIVDGMRAYHHVKMNTKSLSIKANIYSDDKCENVIGNIDPSNTSESIDPSSNEPSEMANSIIELVDIPLNNKKYKQSDVLKFKFKFNVPSNQKYYYVVRKYYDVTAQDKNGIKGYESECALMENGNTTINLPMNVNHRYLTIIAYTDKECTQKLKQDNKVVKYMSGVYESKLDTDELATKTKSDKIDKNVTVKITGPKDIAIKKDTQIVFQAKFNINNNKKYYYIWEVEKNGKVVSKSDCNLAVDKITPYKNVVINKNKTIVRVKVYNNSTCKVNNHVGIAESDTYYIAYDSKKSYQCEEGYYLKGNTCYKKKSTTPQYSYNYDNSKLQYAKKCPSGYSSYNSRTGMCSKVDSKTPQTKSVGHPIYKCAYGEDLGEETNSCWVSPTCPEGYKWKSNLNGQGQCVIINKKEVNGANPYSFAPGSFEARSRGDVKCKKGHLDDRKGVTNYGCIYYKTQYCKKGKLHSDGSGVISCVVQTCDGYLGDYKLKGNKCIGKAYKKAKDNKSKVTGCSSGTLTTLNGKKTCKLSKIVGYACTSTVNDSYNKVSNSTCISSTPSPSKVKVNYYCTSGYTKTGSGANTNCIKK